MGLQSTDFDGVTYDERRDGSRLNGQLRRVFDVMRDGDWYRLRALADKVGASEASVSARIRDLRKAKFGGYDVDRRNRGGGVWEYRLKVPAPKRPQQGALFGDANHRPS